MENVTRPWLSEGEQYFLRKPFPQLDISSPVLESMPHDKLYSKGLVYRASDRYVNNGFYFFTTIECFVNITEKGKQIARQLGSVIS